MKTHISTWSPHCPMAFFMNTKLAIRTSISLSTKSPNIIVTKEALHSSVESFCLESMTVNVIELLPTSCTTSVDRLCNVI